VAARRVRAFVRDQGADVPAAHLAADAHVEAPTTGSVILAGVAAEDGHVRLMKLGFPLFPKPRG